MKKRNVQIDQAVSWALTGREDYWLWIQGHNAWIKAHRERR